MSLDMKIKKNLGGFQLDVELHAGNETLALLGASGCGKSMTLRCIAGIETPDEGYIRVDGETLFDSEEKIDVPVQKRHVGLLFQNYALFPNMNVEQNIMLGMKSLPMPKDQKTAECRRVIEKFYLGRPGKPQCTPAFRGSAAESGSGEDHGLETADPHAGRALFRP